MGVAGVGAALGLVNYRAEQERWVDDAVHQQQDTAANEVMPPNLACRPRLPVDPRHGEECHRDAHAPKEPRRAEVRHPPRKKEQEAVIVRRERPAPLLEAVIFGQGPVADDVLSSLTEK